jgi:hypothetical protein
LIIYLIYLFFFCFFCHIFVLDEAYEEKLRRQQGKMSQRASANRDGATLGGDGGLRVSQHSLEII